jgi:adenylosuccinate synthase
MRRIVTKNTFPGVANACVISEQNFITELSVQEVVKIHSNELSISDHSHSIFIQHSGSMDRNEQLFVFRNSYGMVHIAGKILSR